jgi:hypothetical protein
MTGPAASVICMFLKTLHGRNVVLHMEILELDSHRTEDNNSLPASGGLSKMKTTRIGLLVPVLVSLAFAAKVPDIPTGSKIFLQNKGTSNESQLFTELLREKLSKDETSRNYSKPGFPIVDKKEDAAYTLRFIVVIRQNERGFLESTQEHARVNVWLLDSAGKTVWEHNYDCTRVFREPARECYQHISDDFKAAQVNAEGKRAGWLGWRK